MPTHKVVALTTCIIMALVVVVAAESPTKDPFESADMFIEGEDNLATKGADDETKKKEKDPFEVSDMFLEGEDNLETAPEDDLDGDGAQGEGDGDSDSIDIVDGDAGDQLVETISRSDQDSMKKAIMDAAKEGVQDAKESSTMRPYLFLAAVLGAAAFWYSKDSATSLWLQRMLQKELGTIAIPGISKIRYDPVQQGLLHKSIAKDFGSEHPSCQNSVLSGGSCNYGAGYGSGNYGSSYGGTAPDFGAPKATERAIPKASTSEILDDFGLSSGPADLGAPRASGRGAAKEIDDFGL